MNHIIINVRRKPRASEKLLRYAMAALSALFLLMGIMFSRGMMLPCFLMAMGYFVYTGITRREYEYILENGRMRIDRLTDFGRKTRHEFSLQSVEIVARPDDPSVLPFKKGGSEKIRKYDYTSYEPDVAWYTMIVSEEGRRIKLLMDLNDACIDRIRIENPSALRDSLRPQGVTAQGLGKSPFAKYTEL